VIYPDVNAKFIRIGTKSVNQSQCNCCGIVAEIPSYKPKRTQKLGVIPFKKVACYHM